MKMLHPGFVNDRLTYNPENRVSRWVGSMIHPHIYTQGPCQHKPAQNHPPRKNHTSYSDIFVIFT